MSSKLRQKIRQALTLPPRIILAKVWEIAIRAAQKQSARRRDAGHPTYLQNFPNKPLLHYIKFAPIPNKSADCDLIRRLAELALGHRIDILGSGAVECKYDMEYAGAEGCRYEAAVFQPQINKANYSESKRVSTLLPKSYKLIDWQRDFKSGYRWSESTWSKDIIYGNIPGADVKVPWELARMQHLIVIAQAAALSARGLAGCAPTNRYAEEFTAQIADFISANPPRFGVNWVTSMDVGIRAANWLIAYDIFRSIGVKFSDEWEFIFRRGIWEHASHIASHLEWSSGLRGNHYLADIVGLLFCAAWLPRSAESDVWLAFSVQEIINETNLQFLPDGGNFEASAPYHRLSGEMVAYAAALIEGLPEEKRFALSEYDNRLWKFKPSLKPPSERTGKLLPEFWGRLQSACKFTAIVAGVSPCPQIGDNDSGRFLIATPTLEIMPREQGKAAYLNLSHIDDLPDELLLPISDNHASLLAAAAALPGFQDYLQYAQRFPAEFSLAYALRGLPREEIELYKANAGITTSAVAIENQRESNFNKSGAFTFQDFGLTIVNTGDFTLCLRCGSIGQRGKGGHAHNDQLSFTLSYAERQFFIDPGAYLYTPSPEMRNKFRSTAMHNTLCIKGIEQNQWIQGGGDVLFWMLGDRSKGCVIESSDDYWIAEHYGYGKPHRRKIQWTADSVCGIDGCEAEGDQFLIFHLAPNIITTKQNNNTILLASGDIYLTFSSQGSIDITDSLYSRGYGWLQPAKALVIHGEHNFSWNITTI